MGEFFVGVDLGVTNACVGAYTHGAVEIFVNPEGSRATPLVIGFELGDDEEGGISEERERVVHYDKAARDRAWSNPRGTVFEIVRLLGRKPTDSLLQETIKRVPYEVSEGGGTAGPCVTIAPEGGESETHSAVDLASMSLQRVKSIAETFVGARVGEIVVTVPARSSRGYLDALSAAVSRAGLKSRCLLSDAHAAAMAYGLHETLSPGDSVLVFHFGGATVRSTVLRAGVGGAFELLSHNCEPFLGGRDLDSAILEHCLTDFKRKFGCDLTSAKARSRLMDACTFAKCVLSDANVFDQAIQVDSLFEGNDYKIRISRARFESLCETHFDRAVATARKTMEQARVGHDGISAVVLTGGSCRIPKIRTMISTLVEPSGFPENVESKKIKVGINPEEVEAWGAAVWAKIHASDENGTIDGPRTEGVQEETSPEDAEEARKAFEDIVLSLENLRTAKIAETREMLVILETPSERGLMMRASPQELRAAKADLKRYLDWLEGEGFNPKVAMEKFRQAKTEAQTPAAAAQTLKSRCAALAVESRRKYDFIRLRADFQRDLREIERAALAGSLSPEQRETQLAERVSSPLGNARLLAAVRAFEHRGESVRFDDLAALETLSAELKTTWPRVIEEEEKKRRKEEEDEEGDSFDEEGINDIPDIIEGWGLATRRRRAEKRRTTGYGMSSVFVIVRKSARAKKV